jgi:hypothetical protein
MTYTISVQDENGYSIPLKRSKETKDKVLFAAWKFSQNATLCDVVVKHGSKHVATYRRGVVKVWNGKEQKP